MVVSKKRAPLKKVFAEVLVSSVSQFIAEVVKAAPASSYLRTYRGHSKQTYKLKPSLYRNISHMKEEKNILREIIVLHPSEFERDKSAFDQLVRMQHFSLETRFLDVSMNPLVALYFACISNPKADGHVVYLDVQKKHIKYFDSDTVSCVANLASLSSKERNEIRSFKNDSELNSSEAGLRLLHFIKTEKPYFLPKIRLADLNRVVLVKPKQNNRRILAQQGLFFIFGLSDEIDQAYDMIDIGRFKIPAASKRDIIKELDLLNINGSSMFPEMESAAKYIMSKLVHA